MPATIYRSLGLHLTATTSKSNVLRINGTVRLSEMHLFIAVWQVRDLGAMV